MHAAVLAAHGRRADDRPRHLARRADPVADRLRGRLEALEREPPRKPLAGQRPAPLVDQLEARDQLGERRGEQLGRSGEADQAGRRVVRIDEPPGGILHRDPVGDLAQDQREAGVRLAQRAIGLGPLRQQARHTEDEPRLALPAEDGRADALDRDVVAVVMADADRRERRRAARERLLDRGLHGGHVGRVHEVDGLRPDELGGRVAEQRADGWRDEHDRAGGVEQRDQLAAVFDRESPELVELEHLRVRFGHVPPGRVRWTRTR